MRSFSVYGAAAALALLAQAPGAARQDVPRSPRNASYRLAATLDPATHTITGTGRLTWRNLTSQPATELQFHLYWNAWRDPSSSWLREQRLGRTSRLSERPAADRGSMDLTSLTLAGGAAPVDLLTGAHFIAPDDGNADDRTVLAVPLARPAGPGESIEVDFAWTAHVPRTYARTGVIGNYYFVGQWFPKLGVFEDTGWNCHQFHASTEFFSDFGVYDVSLTVPAGWVVGATGASESATANNNGTTTHRFVERDVHDFAWTTSPDFLDKRETFDAPGLPKVQIRLLLQPEHASQADRHFTATRAALQYYGSWFGPYPYAQITVVDPVTIFNAASQGENTGGMEYPTLFTAGTRLLAPRNGLQPESVTIHEAGHQFWYGIVATNEFEHAWMDEGFNTFSTARTIEAGLPQSFVAVDRYFGGFIPWSYTDVAWSRAVDGNRLNAYRPVANFDVQSTPTWRYWPGSASAITYNKTSLWLASLERLLGWPVVQRILATHFARGAFRHPTPDEFFKLATEISGRDLSWFFDAMHKSSAVFDYGVAQVSNTPGDRLVVVRRIGDGVFPIDIRVTFDDGAVSITRWSGGDRWQALRFPDRPPITTVEIDPNRVLLLDVNYTNNSWTATPRTADASRKWSLRWLTWLEEVMLTFSFLS